MADFKVTASQLNTQAESLQDLNGRFKSAIEQLVTSETSLKSMWEGEANDAFHAAFTSDKAKMDEDMEQLDTLNKLFHILVH